MFAPSDYTFDLPAELIAQQPTVERDASRLLHLHGDGAVSDHAFREIVELLPADAVVVANDTRVIAARVLGHKPAGGRVELLFLEPELATPAPPGTTAWRCLARARRPLRVGQTIRVAGGDPSPAGSAAEGRRGLIAGGDPSPAGSAAEGRRGLNDGPGSDVTLELLSERAADGSVVIAAPGDGFRLLEQHGHMPLPRYIQRADRAEDRERYQTIFARVPGAVAAPTAGLHVTPAIVERLTARGIALATVTLHVGYGTFEPIREPDIRQHRMHRERYAIPPATAALVASGRPIVALGTTALRALEASKGVAGAGTTELFVYPGSGHAFSVVSHLITNFHLPESTLLMLVCAFAGTAPVLAAYRHAVAARYRFFSYGDAMLVHRA